MNPLQRRDLNAFYLKNKKMLSLVGIALTLLLIHFVWKKISIASDPTVIVVLGGGVTASGELPLHSLLRVERAVELFQALKGDAIVITLSGGTPHKPNPLDSRGFPVWEATAAAKKLIELGVPSSQVYEEIVSLDTVGNAYFLRAIHMEPTTYRKLTIITNDWHMPRTKSIFEYVFSLPSNPRYCYISQAMSTSSPSSDLKITTAVYFVRTWNNMVAWLSQWSKHRCEHPDYQLTFEAVSSGIDDPELLKLRTAKESASLKHFLTVTRTKFATFPEMHRWLFTTHSAYATSRLHSKGSASNIGISAELLKTY